MTLYRHSVPMTAKLSVDDLLCISDLVENDKDLRSLCRCCRPLNKRIQPRLFYRIDLVTFKYHEGKADSFAAFRQILERSAHLADYPREVRIKLGIQGTEDVVYALTALTGKNVSVIKLTTDRCGWSSTVVKSAVETFFRNTIIPLNINLSGLPGLSASCLHFTEHVILFDCSIDSTGAQDICRTKTITMAGFGRCTSLGALVSNVLPCLTHLMLWWDEPSGEPGEWYAELGTALSNLPKLALLTVQYCGKNTDSSSFSTLLMEFVGGCTRNEYLEAYASRIQHSVMQYPRRASLEWRFLDLREYNAVRVIQSLRVLSRWHTISFQVDIEENLGGAMVQVATEALLKHSDNYYVRVDEVYTRYGLLSTAPHRSTLVIKSNALDVVQRQVHEDAYPRQLDDGEWTPVRLSELRFRPGEWETRMVRI
jgi:hypothetical protein